LRFDICWRIAEAEAALAGFPLIDPAHFWIGVCKAVELRQKTSRHKTQEKRKTDARGTADEKPKKKTALERFGRLTAGGWKR